MTVSGISVTFYKTLIEFNWVFNFLVYIYIDDE